jgi:U3 small nucleolar RNA-associated protein 10
MTPYLSFLLPPFVELLQGSDDQEEDPIGPAQLCVVQTLTKSMNVDEGGPYTRLLQHPPRADRPLTPSIPFPVTAFWRDDRLKQVTPVLVALVAPAGALASLGAGMDQDASPLPRGSGDGGRERVSAGLVALCGAATDDTLLKQLNLDVLMHTRADDARVRVFALRCARAIWTAHGSKLIGALERPSLPPY